jgi:hypothetical protein
MSIAPKNDSKNKMKTAILTIFKSFKTYVEYYLAFASIVGILWGGFTAYANWKNTDQVLQTNVKTIMETQFRQGKIDSLLLENQSEIRGKLNNIETTTSSLQSSYVKYISNDKTLTKQDFLRYMEGLSFDVKKNSPTSMIDPLKK